MKSISFYRVDFKKKKTPLFTEADAGWKSRGRIGSKRRESVPLQEKHAAKKKKKNHAKLLEMHQETD